MYVQAIINTEKNEYHHTIKDCDSLDKLLERIKEPYPEATSVVLTVVLNPPK